MKKNFPNESIYKFDEFFGNILQKLSLDEKWNKDMKDRIFKGLSFRERAQYMSGQQSK